MQNCLRQNTRQGGRGCRGSIDGTSSVARPRRARLWRAARQLSSGARCSTGASRGAACFGVSCASAVLDALPGKKPLIKLSYRPPNA